MEERNINTTWDPKINFKSKKTGKPITEDLSSYTVKYGLKKNKNDTEFVHAGFPVDGEGEVGSVKAKIPTSITSTLAPGKYWEEFAYEIGSGDSHSRKVKNRRIKVERVVI